MPSGRSASEQRRVALASGRVLGFAEYGDAGGFPVLFFHGAPGCRLDAAPLGADAAACGVRLVAVDRPGVGLSDPAPGRTYLDWPGDVDGLADRLGLARFSVLGFSSGGPYALATTFSLGGTGRLAACAVASGNSPVDDPEVVRTLPPDSRVFARLLGRSPGAARSVAGAMLRVARLTARWRPGLAGALLSLQFPTTDRAVLARMGERHDRRAVVEGFVESVRQGGAGVLRDLELEVGDWGFDLGGIGMDVHLWYGTADRLVPPVQARYLARLLAHPVPHAVVGGGHLILYERAREILTGLTPGP